MYTLCLDPPYPTPACDNGHQVGHYTGISKRGRFALPGRLRVQAEGGPDAARLLQVQKAAGGTFVLVSVEWGTQDRETALKYRAATDRCSRCNAGPPPPGEALPDLGWVCVVHLEPSGPRPAPRPGAKPRQPAHWTVFIPSTQSMYEALGHGGRDIAQVLQVPEAHGGTWRLGWAERAAADRVACYTPSEAERDCPLCRAAREQARADELLAAIERGEVADRLFPDPSSTSGESWDARWHTRNGQPVWGPRADPGRALGRKVNRTATALVRRGLAKRAKDPPPGTPGDAQHADLPYMITRAGRAALRGQRPRRRPRGGRPPYPRRQPPAAPPEPRADGLPVRRDGGLNLAKCTDRQRAEAGAMTRKQAKEHRELCTLDERVLGELLGDDRDRQPRRAERLRGPLRDEHKWTAASAPPIPPAALGPAGPPNGSPALPPGAASQREAPIISPGPQAAPSRRAPDPSWPSTAYDGVTAAANLAAVRARRPAASYGRDTRRSMRGTGR